MRLKVVYDNRICTPGLREGWGFACLIEQGDERILFDTGAEGELLLANMQRMKIDPASITKIVISHDDWDHVGGLPELFAACTEPQVFLLPSFNDDLRVMVESAALSQSVGAAGWLAEGIWSTGPLPRINPPTETGDEQALALRGSRGFLLLTGCGHPGVIQLVRHCRKGLGRAPSMIVGGLHLKDLPPREVAEIIAELRGLGVERVAPCHCTGAGAMEQFSTAFSTNYVEVATGSIIEWP